MQERSMIRTEKWTLQFPYVACAACNHSATRELQVSVLITKQKTQYTYTQKNIARGNEISFAGNKSEFLTTD